MKDRPRVLFGRLWRPWKAKEGQTQGLVWEDLQDLGILPKHFYEGQTRGLVWEALEALEPLPRSIL